MQGTTPGAIGPLLSTVGVDGELSISVTQPHLRLRQPVFVPAVRAMRINAVVADWYHTTDEKWSFCPLQCGCMVEWYVQTPHSWPRTLTNRVLSERRSCKDLRDWLLPYLPFTFLAFHSQLRNLQC